MKSPLQVLVHFIRRDTYDFLIGWILLGFVIIATLPLQLSQGETKQTLSYCFLLLMMLYSKQVWGEGPLAGNIISRSYLRTLPISRLHLFMMNLARNAVGGLPILIYGTYTLYQTKVTLLESLLLGTLSSFEKGIILIQVFGFVVVSILFFMIFYIDKYIQKCLQ